MSVQLRYTPVRRIIYTSRSLLGDAPSVVEALIERSSVRNAASNITGMLWSDGACFAQVLEGDEHAIEALFHRIKADSRHDNIEVVCDRLVTHRLFGQWGMAQPDDGSVSMYNTAYLIGLAVTEKNGTCQRLAEIVIASTDQPPNRQAFTF